MDLRHPGFVILILSSLLTGAAQAGGGVDCVKAECEAAGRSCVETLYAAEAVCMKAARKKCDSVQPAEKFDCLKAGLTPCAQTRNAQNEACLAAFRSCHATCGPFDDGKAHYWCVGDFGTATTAAFCATDPASERPMDECQKIMSSQGPLSGSMTCDSL
jgi:hypothetical protein